MHDDWLATHKSQRHSFATAELPAEEVEAIAKTRMHPRHNKLNALLGKGKHQEKSRAARSEDGRQTS